jgi:hypothetical protein
LGSGQLINSVFLSTLKDEMLSLSKIRRGKVRIFDAASLEFTLLVRKYFGDFITYFKKHAGFNLYHTIGVDNEAAWKSIYIGLLQISDRGVDFDYSNYDATVQPGAFDFFLNITDHYYGKQNMIERHALLHSMRNAHLLLGDMAIEMHLGNRSGNPMTDVFNSISNIWLVYNITLLHKRQAGLDVDLEDFDGNVRMLTYGDDVIATLSPHYETLLNRVVYQESAALVGMKVTAADKEGLIVPISPLKDLTFLKSTFRVREGLVRKQLPIEVIHRELRWNKKENVGDLGVLQQRIDQALNMMAQYGQEEFEQLKQQINSLGYQTLSEYNRWLINMRIKQNEVGVEMMKLQSIKYINRK